jgi:hypothetical protein
MGLVLRIDKISKFGFVSQPTYKYYPPSQFPEALDFLKELCLGKRNILYVPAKAKADQSALNTTGQASQMAVCPDFDGDGIPDRARISSSNSIVVELLAADGSVCTGNSFTTKVGTDIAYLEAADFNSDGKPDLAVHNSGSDTVSGLLGKGDGTFQAAVHSPGAPGLAGDGYLAWADLNHDSKLDLVLAYHNSNILSVFLGKGDGSFQAPVNYVGPSVPVSLAIGPQPDGSFSLFASDRWTNELFALYSPGDGTLNAPVMEATGNAYSIPAAGDLDGDGKPDMAIADQQTNSILVRLNDGNGNLQAPASHTVLATPQMVAMADVNGDARPDLLATYSDLRRSNGNSRLLLFSRPARR